MCVFVGGKGARCVGCAARVDKGVLGWGGARTRTVPRHGLRDARVDGRDGGAGEVRRVVVEVVGLDLLGKRQRAAGSGQLRHATVWTAVLQEYSLVIWAWLWATNATAINRNRR